jgi:hypothetical protein
MIKPPVHLDIRYIFKTDAFVGNKYFNVSFFTVLYSICISARTYHKTFSIPLETGDNEDQRRAFKPKFLLFVSVLRIRNVYPGSRILIFTHPGSRISDPGSQIQKQQQMREVKNILLSYLFCSHKFHKIANYLIFCVLKKKIWSNEFSKNYRTFYPKNCH